MMTSEEALDEFRARWTHPSVDVRDVEERIAIRGAEAETRVLPGPLGAARVFVRGGPSVTKSGKPKDRFGEPLFEWCSAYIHHPDETDGVLSRLLKFLEASCG